MNFLLHMIGQPHRSPEFLRPSGDQLLRNAAAAAAAKGHLADALHAYQQLASESHGSITDNLIRAHLLLALNDYPEAFAAFSAALTRLEDQPLNTLDNLMDTADEHLRCSRFNRATDLLQIARGTVDTLLSAHAGLAVANARMAGATSVTAGLILPLAKLGDLLLRMLARTHLAGNLAISLRQRALRHDLAPWATSSANVEKLLAAEFDQLQKSARAHPSHAELHYRLGLVARTLGRFPEATRAFTRVISLHPHHVPSAARLAATHLQLNQDDLVLPILAVAFAAPPNMLEQYAGLAASAQTAAFNRAADSLSQCSDNAGIPQARATVKANLAFALGEMGLLDPARSQWREVTSA